MSDEVIYYCEQGNPYCNCTYPKCKCNTAREDKKEPIATKRKRIIITNSNDTDISITPLLNKQIGLVNISIQCDRSIKEIILNEKEYNDFVKLINEQEDGAK